MNPGGLGRQDHAQQLIEFLSCFSTMMPTLHDGSLV